MRKLLPLVFFAMCVCVHAEGIVWPPLPKQGFIVGHAATESDVSAHNAVFATTVGGLSIGKPLQMTIPQYAYHVSQGKRVPVVLVQSEQAQGKNSVSYRVIGARDLNGQEIVGLFTEFELLGNIPPKVVAP